MEEMTRLFNLDFQLLHDTVLLAIAIFFLFLALSYLLFNPVRKMLKDRQEKIATDIDTALADKKDAAALKAEYEAKLKNIDKEAEQILSEARQKALKNEFDSGRNLKPCLARCHSCCHISRTYTCGKCAERTVCTGM